MPKRIELPSEIFHYTRLEICLESILAEGKLRFNSVTKTNDPRESQSWKFGIELNDQMEAWLTENQFEGYFDNYRARHLKALCFSLNDEGFSSTRSTVYHGGTKPAMWAHYGERHRGICLEFDGPLLNRNIEERFNSTHEIWPCEVRYLDKESEYRASLGEISIEAKTHKDILNDDFIRKFIIENKKRILFTKTLDWESENEFRWVIHRSPGESNLPQLPPDIEIQDSLKSIIVGSLTPKCYRKLLIDLSKKYGSELKKVDWINGIPRLIDWYA